MQDDPFVTLAETMRQEAEAAQGIGPSFGRVVSASPLKVSVQGLEVTAERLDKNSNISLFYAGEQLLLMPSEEAQRWVILCKVVSA